MRKASSYESIRAASSSCCGCSTRRAALRVGTLGGEENSGGGGVEGAGPVRGPGADRRIAAETVARVHLEHRRRGIHRIDLAAAKKANVVRDAREVLPIFRHIRAALA